MIKVFENFKVKILYFETENLSQKQVPGVFDLQ